MSIQQFWRLKQKSAETALMKFDKLPQKSERETEKDSTETESGNGSSSLSQKRSKSPTSLSFSSSRSKSEAKNPILSDGAKRFSTVPDENNKSTGAKNREKTFSAINKQSSSISQPNQNDNGEKSIKIEDGEATDRSGNSFPSTVNRDGKLPISSDLHDSRSDQSSTAKIMSESEDYNGSR